MKRILILCRHFPPNSLMVALRPAKLAKYLQREHDCHVTVIAQTPASTPKDASDSLMDVREIQDAGWVLWLKKQRSGNAEGQWSYPEGEVCLSRSLYWYFRVFVEWAKERAFARRMVKAALDTPGQEYDAVFSTYGPPGPHFAAYGIKRRFPALRWVADFSDPANSKDMRFPAFALRARDLTRKVFRRADAITITAESIRDDMEWPEDARIHMIPNGYDPEDMECEEGADSAVFRMAYTGALYGKKRDLSVFFEVLRELVDEGVLDESLLRVDYAGSDFALLRQTAEKYGMKGVLRDHGYISREEALRLQSRARLLLLCAWSNPGIDRPLDTVPGKLYEYMAVGRPVLAVIAGDTPNPTVQGHIEKGRMGYCHVPGGALAPMKDFLLAQYHAFARGEAPPFSPNEEYLEQFNYRNIAARIMELL